MQRDVLLLTEMIDAAEQAQKSVKTEEAHISCRNWAVRAAP